MCYCNGCPHNWELHHLDIKTAFLNGLLAEEVYVAEPPSFEVIGSEKKVCRLKKALYGLKQAPRAWYDRIHTHLLSLGFQNSPTEVTLYIRKRGADLLILILYVDDMILTGPHPEKIADFKRELQQSFAMTDLGKLHYYLGIQFSRTKGESSCHNQNILGSSYKDFS